MALVLGSGACLLLTAGCASPAKATAMTPAAFRVATQHPGSAIVHVEGGAETDPNLMPEVSSGAFREALVAAIGESRVFASIREQAPADYRLDVSVVKVHTRGAFTLRAVMAARWKLTRLNDSRVALDEFIESNAQATVGEAFAGLTRVRVAIEKAGRENIRTGLARLATLEL